MINIDGLIKIPEAIKIYEKPGSKDSLFVVSDDSQTIEITKTNYVTNDNWQVWNSYRVYSYASAKVAFNEDLINIANNFGSEKCPV